MNLNITPYLLLIGAIYFQWTTFYQLLKLIQALANLNSKVDLIDDEEEGLEIPATLNQILKLAGAINKETIKKNSKTKK